MGVSSQPSQLLGRDTAPLVSSPLTTLLRNMSIFSERQAESLWWFKDKSFHLQEVGMSAIIPQQSVYPDTWVNLASWHIATEGICHVWASFFSLSFSYLSMPLLPTYLSFNLFTYTIFPMVFKRELKENINL